MSDNQQKRSARPHTVNVTHNYPPSQPPDPGSLEAIRSLSKAVRANASAIEQNAVAIQKIAMITADLGGSTLNVEASAFTAKNGACMNVSGADISFDKPKQP